MPTDLASLLVEDGAIAAEAMERAVSRQASAGGALDTALLELGLIAEPELVDALCRASGLPPAPAGAWEAADARARRVFPSRVAERHGLAPFALDGRELSLVASYPVDVELLGEISFMLSLHLTAHVGPEWRVRELIHRLYGAPLAPRFAALDGAPAPTPFEAQAPVTAPLPEEDGDAGLDGPDWTAGPVLAPEEPAAAPVAPPAPGFDPEPPLQPLAAALTAALEAELFGAGSARTPAPVPEPELALAAESAEPAAGRDRLGSEPAPLDAAREAAAPAATTGSAAEPSPDRRAPPGWSLAEARAAVAAAQDRDGVVLAALRYARDFFEVAAIFAVARDAVAGHDALGPDGDDARELCRSVAFYTSEPGAFHNALESGAPHLGPMTRELAGDRAVLDGLARGAPRTVLVHPVFVRDRPVCVLYADGGDAPVSPDRLSDLLLLLAGLGAAFERVIHGRKQRLAGRGEAAPAQAAPPPPEPDPTPFAAPSRTPPPASSRPPAAPPREPDPWLTLEPAEALGDLEVDVDLDLEPPPVLDPAAPRRYDPEAAVTALLATAAGSPERELAVARIAERPQESLPVLWARLPGPLEPSGPEAGPAALGPLAAALAALGPAAVPAMLEVLRDPDPARRRVAVAVLGASGAPAAFPALAERALDPDPAVAAAAAAALAAHRRAPEMRAAPEKLRRALLSGIAVRATGAARALGALRDVEAIPLLIQVLESSEREPAAAAAEALSRITLQRLGADARRWLAWWKANRGRGRAEWLLSGLTSPDREVRVAAAAELSEAAPAPVAYSADAPAPEREQAARSWAGWWARSGGII